MHWLLFIHKIIFSSTCFEHQVLIFRRIQLYTCSIWYCKSHREWQYHMLHVYNCILLKMSTWSSKHVENNSILGINNNQCIKVVINIFIVQNMLYFGFLKKPSSVSVSKIQEKNHLQNLSVLYMRAFSVIFLSLCLLKAFCKSG